MIQIPEVLQDPDLRFYLVRRNDKRAFEKAWNKKDGSNYYFHEQHLTCHAGNYGVVCGLGGLIVLDFDCPKFYESVKDKLKNTFTVTTAGKRLPHLYYFLTDEMIATTRIKEEGMCRCGHEKNRHTKKCMVKGCTCKKARKNWMDLQAAGAGVVGPGSVCGRRFYEVTTDIPIADITLLELKETFDLYTHEAKEYDELPEDIPKLINTVKGLRALGLKQTGKTHFCCPYHSSVREMSLCTYSDGRIYCHSCQRYWATLQKFEIDYARLKGRLEV